MATEFLEPTPAAVSTFKSSDILSILKACGWLAPETAVEEWAVRAAALLGPHAATQEALADFLRLVFAYNAVESLKRPEHQAVMTRDGAREVIRALGLAILAMDPAQPLDSDCLKEIVNRLKQAQAHRGRELFFPLRLALAGRIGDGALDRVILLLDPAAALPFSVRVKGTRERMLEFLAALG